MTYLLIFILIVSLIGVARCPASTGTLLENNTIGPGNRPQEPALGVATPGGDGACILVENSLGPQGQVNVWVDREWTGCSLGHWVSAPGG